MYILNLTDAFAITTLPQGVSEKNGIISDELRDVLMFINYGIVCGTISLFGFIFNIINILVFIKIGFQDSVNISFLHLAVSDAGSLVFLIFVGILYNPLFMEHFPTWDFNDIMYLIVGWPSVTFSRIGSWITVFITVERYLCIAMPLKVRSMITPQTTVIANIFIFISVFSSYLPGFLVLRIGSKYNLKRNATVLGLVYTDKIKDGETVEDGTAIFSAIFQVIAFACVVVLTILLLHQFAKTAEWRSSVSSSRNGHTTSNRDRKLVKMIILIAIIFLICNTPMVITQSIIGTFPEFSITGKYRNFFLIWGQLGFTFQAINSTANIFVYINLSSKFHDVFMSMFGLERLRKFTDKILKKSRDCINHPSPEQ